MNPGALYRELHASPELSGAEVRTAARLARELTALGVDVTAGVGGHGVVGVLRNGAGPVVMLRADMDGLPVEETTGLPYASTVRAPGPDGIAVPVMHACGHDMHCAAMIGAVSALVSGADGWSGTLVIVLQPAEETLSGSQAMIDDGLLDRFPAPGVVLGQHVWPLPPGVVGTAPGVLTSAADGIEITVYGRGGHGSRPDTTINPLTTAAHVVTRLQDVVAGAVPPGESAVLGVGRLHGGSRMNIVPDSAEIGLAVRTYSEGARTRILDAIERIVRHESAAAGDVPTPEIRRVVSTPSVVNDPDATARTTAALTDAFGPDRVLHLPPQSFSEDFGRLPAAAGVPGVFWIWGGPADTGDEPVPSNHSPRFAPVLEPTLSTGIDALVAAARLWLGP